MEYNYIEDRESIKLMRLNKICKDMLFEQIYNRKYSKLLLDRSSKFVHCFLNIFKDGLTKWFLKLLWTLFPKRIKNHELIYDFNEEMEFMPIRNNLNNNSKIVVYTSVFGDYDKIKEPFFVNDKIKYYAITDQKLSSDSVWEKKDVSSICGFEKMDAYHKSKYCKLHPHILFPDYEYSIWVDGNIQIVADVLPLIFKMNNHFMGTYNNPFHDDVYTEGRFCVYYNAVHLKDVKRQLQQYKKDGFPKHYGMREFSIIVRQHNEKKCIDLMEQWWKEVNTYTMRDQLSLPYLLWKNNLTIDTIQLLGENWRHNPRFIASSHKKAHSYFKQK